eukprot:12784527-Prorocentrum_lima.AAC.1
MLQNTTLRTEGQQARAQGQVSPRTVDSRALAELERRLLATEAEEQARVESIRQSEIAIQFELA